MKMLLTGILCFLLINTVGAESYFYAENVRIGTKTNGEFTNNYENRIMGDMATRTLPFGQVIFSDSRFGFTGKEQDASGVMYFGARYYDPQLGRFSTIDPVEDEPAYIYVSNNPLKFVDPMGTEKTDSTWRKIWSGTKTTAKWGGRGLYLLDIIDLATSYKERGPLGALKTGAGIAGWELLVRYPKPTLAAGTVVGGTLAWYYWAGNHFASLSNKRETMGALKSIHYEFTDEDYMDNTGQMKRSFAKQFVERSKRGMPVTTFELGMISGDQYTYEVTIDEVVKAIYLLDEKMANLISPALKHHHQKFGIDILPNLLNRTHSLWIFDHRYSKISVSLHP